MTREEIIESFLETIPAYRDYSDEYGVYCEDTNSNQIIEYMKILGSDSLDVSSLGLKNRAGNSVSEIRLRSDGLYTYTDVPEEGCSGYEQYSYYSNGYDEIYDYIFKDVDLWKMKEEFMMKKLESLPDNELRSVIIEMLVSECGYNTGYVKVPDGILRYSDRTDDYIKEIYLNPDFPKRGLFPVYVFFNSYSHSDDDRFFNLREDEKSVFYTAVDDLDPEYQKAVLEYILTNV